MIRRNFIFPVLLTAALFVSSAAQALIYTVTNTDDSGAGSLRQAILDTINDGGGAIVFNVPGTAPFVISPMSPLPSFSQNIIDGSTQPGFLTEPVVVIDGSLQAGGGRGFDLGANNTVTSLAFQNFSEAGLAIGGSNNVVQNSSFVSNTVGVLSSPSLNSNILNNLISGNFEDGLRAANFSRSTSVTGNTITGNLQNGIAVSNNSNGIRISQNSITGNGALGIDLGEDGVTANDLDDLDGSVTAFANNGQNFPLLTSAQSNGCGSYTLEGALATDPGILSNYELEFFSNTQADASGNGEGEAFLDTITATPASGQAPFQINGSGNLAIGSFVSSTATLSSVGHSSEFSPVIEVTPLVIPGDFGSLGLSANTATVAESAGTVALTLVRTCGFSGSVSADVNTSDGTAIAGQDYEALSQTVIFAEGETQKDVPITLLQDAQTESDKTFNVTLSNVTGATAGGITTAAVTITDGVAPVCGNGVVEFGEGCDDGNADDTDACLTTCVSATCGDGIVQAGIEECDGGDQCTSDCHTVIVPSTGDTGGDNTDNTNNNGNPSSSGGSGGGCSLIR